MKIELSDEEADFLASLLKNIQLSGTPDQVRQTLALIEAIERKLASISEEVTA